MVKQIEIGENTNLVTDVLDFVSSKKLLRGFAQSSLEEDVITDIEAAKEFAWDKVYGEDEFTWADLRSEKMSEIWDVIYSDEDKYSKVDNNLISILDELSQVIQKQLDQKHKELLDDIVSDLKGCLYSRAIFGKDNAFFENIYLTYLNGGWPCGWKGNWPNGHIIYYKLVI